MKLKQLEIFRSVMIAGSMVGAARLLHVSQPAISQAIHQMEKQTGVRLFRRVNGKIFATAEANILFTEIERVYAGVKNLERLAEGLRHNRHGSLRLAGFPAISRQLLPAIVADYCRDRPEVDIVLDSTQSRNIPDLVARREIDVALSVLPSDRDEVEATVINTVNAVCILPVGHRLCDKTVIHAADLDGEAFISLGRNDQSRLMIDKVFEAQGVRRRLQMETTQSDTACGFVAEGSGVSIVDEMTMSWYRDERIAVLPFEPLISFNIWLLSLKGSTQPLLTRDFAEFLQTRLADALRRPTG
ncbi:MAG: LysR family transcriptional regulator [Rhizobiales bacterium]|nr:LysR family transcriptional regulator [Hyphomicrobiales bacterium]